MNPIYTRIYTSNYNSTSTSTLTYTDSITLRSVLTQPILTALSNGGKVSRQGMEGFRPSWVDPLEYTRLLGRLVVEGRIKCGIHDGRLVYFR
jgi:hypothetical protein